MNLDAPEEGVIPDGYNSIDVFQKLLLIRLDPAAGLLLMCLNTRYDVIIFDVVVFVFFIGLGALTEHCVRP